MLPYSCQLLTFPYVNASSDVFIIFQDSEKLKSELQSLKGEFEKEKDSSTKLNTSVNEVSVFFSKFCMKIASQC